eukprot:499123_1
MGLLNISFTTLESNDVSDMLVFNGMDSADLFIDTLTIQHNNRIVPGMSLLSLNNFEDVNIYNTMMRANNVKKYLIYGVLFGDAVMQNIKFIRNKVDFEIVRIFGDDSNNASASSITFGGVTIQDTRESSMNNVTQSLMSINGFGFVSFAMVNFTNNSAVNLLVFRLTGTEIDFADAIISDNVLENNLLDFSGQGSISLVDSNFNQNAANTLISSIGVDYNTDSLFLQLNTISFIDNDITKSVFEMGDVSADLLGMTLSENKLFINIISVVDIEIKESEIMDMSGIYMDATVNASMFGASKINISDSNFTARHFSSEYFGITSYMNPNDEIYVYRSEFKLLPIRIFANDLSGLSPINNENTALLFAECEFTDLNNRTAFKFESLGHHWYPNITFDTCLFNDTKLNVIETETIHDPLFYSSIILKQCTFEQVSGTAVFHTFIVPPIIHISFQSGTWQNYVLSTPFLIAKLSNSTYFPCTSLPQFVTHSLVDTIFIDNKIADGMFEVECSNIQFKNSIFIRNQELSGTKVGLIDVGGGNNVWIHNCTFQENQFNFVGLIYDYGDQIDETLNPLVSITDSTFISNSAPKGSIISVLYDNPSSSYEYFGPSYSINNSLFDSNIATDSGAIIYIDINDTNYDKQLQIHNCTIQNNIALNHGGAIYSKDFTISISSSMFENNSATISGGCIALMSDTCDYTTAALYVQNSSIIRSKASIGGAIIIGCSEMYITGGSNQITNNEASYRGGAIHSHHSCISSLAEAEVLFESNAADYGGDISFTGGVADGHSCNSELRANTRFHKSKAYVHGGSIHILYAQRAGNNPNNTNVLSLPTYLSRYKTQWQNATTSLIIAHASFMYTQGADYGSGITVEYGDYHDDEIVMDSNGLPLSVQIENSLFDTNVLMSSNNRSYGGNGIAFLAHHNSVFHQLIVKDSEFTNTDFSDPTISIYGGHIWIDLNICTKNLDLENYEADNCICIEQFNQSFHIDFELFQSVFSHSYAVFGGAVYSKLPITIHANFTHTSALEGGAIYVGCADNVELNECYFKSTHSDTHGGAVSLNKLQNVFIESTVFDSCSARYAGGALAYIMHEDYNSNIQITSSTKFINNTAVCGGALFSSQHRLGIITETKRILIERNITTLVDIDLNTLDVDEFETQYIFVLLQPTADTLENLVWNEDFVWNDSVIEVSNDISVTTLTFSTVDDTRFISPLFIPLTTTSRDKTWDVSPSISWEIKMNFGPLWDALMYGQNVTELQFDLFLLSYEFVYDTIRQNIIGKSLLLTLEDDISFDNNFASALGAAIYVNDDLFPHFTIVMNRVTFTGNEASGLSSFAINSYVADETADGTDVNKQIQASNVKFTRNIAYTSSACLSVIATNLTCSKCVFSQNTVSTFGAALYVKDGEIHLSGNSKIKDNNSPLGGNLLLYKSKLIISDTIFDGNLANNGNGAGISIYGLNELIAEKSNTTLDDDGIITDLIVPDLVVISGCTFTNHTSKGDGSALYIYLEDQDQLNMQDDAPSRRRLERMPRYQTNTNRRRLLQSNWTADNVTNNTIPVFTTTPYKTTHLFTTIDPTNEPTLEPTYLPTLEPTIVPTAHPTNLPTVYPTSVPTMDPTSIPTVDPTVDPTKIPTTEPTVVPTAVPTLEPTTDPTRFPTGYPTKQPSLVPTVDADCVWINIVPDYWTQDISWTLSVGSDSTDGNAIVRTGECLEVSSTTECITFAIDDHGKDGLNYGQGSYFVTWGDTMWESLSSGNYFNHEWMTLCDSSVLSTTHFDVYVSIQDPLSVGFLNFLEDTINPRMDYTLMYNIIFADIQLENDTMCANNTSTHSYDCMDGFCACNADGNNNTLSNIIMALCYASHLETIIEWQPFWDDTVENGTMETMMTQCNASSLLSTNYQSMAKSPVTQFPSFSHIAMSAYESEINDLLYVNISACNLYAMFMEMMDEMCSSYVHENVPYLCQATPDRCGSDFYCNATEAYLLYHSESTSGTVPFTQYSYIDTVGSPLLNISYLPSTLYGVDEYNGKAENPCLNFSSLVAQNTSADDIANTIPVVAAVFDTCDYIDLFVQLQNHGARAIIVLTFIQDSTEEPTSAPTKAPFISPLNYNYWLPFDCTIDIHAHFADYASFVPIRDNITAFMTTVSRTNLRNVLLTNVSLDTISYSFEANTTFSSLSFVAVDSMMSALLGGYLRTTLSNLNGIQRVSCLHHQQFNESYSNPPSPGPTHEPTLSPTARSAAYEDIYIPIEVVSLSSAQQLFEAIEPASDMRIALSCQTASPTRDPTEAPVESIVAQNTSQETNADAQLVIFGYKTEESASVALNFPEIDWTTFGEVFTESCGWELDHSRDELDVYLVSVDTIYESIEELCIRFNNQDTVLKPDADTVESDEDGLYTWTATQTSILEASCSDGLHRMLVEDLDRGSYCFAAYRTKLDSTVYHFKLQKRFKWTTPYIHIQSSSFTDNICTNGMGGALAIVSQDGIDECFSAKISDSNFTGNYAMFGGGAIYREYSLTQYYQSVYMSVLELEEVHIGVSMVSAGEGGSIKTDLASAHNANGFYFKHVLSITESIIGSSTTAQNETALKLLRSMNRRRLEEDEAGDPDDGYGGVLHFKYGNVFIGNSIIENGRAYQGGGIYLFDTVFQLFGSLIVGNEASGDGGGLYQSLYTQYTSFDVCVSIYQSRFVDNVAGGLGGAIYAKLHGKIIGISNTANREQCFKIINGTFVDNGNVTAYVDVTGGVHKVLRNQGALTTFCPDAGECVGIRSGLAYLCVDKFVAECSLDWSPNPGGISDPQPLAAEGLSDIPGASIILYVYGFDISGIKLFNTEFGIKATSNGAQVINPFGTQTKASIDKYQYIVPLVVATGSTDSEGLVVDVADIKGSADAVSIDLKITHCTSGNHEKQVGNSDLFDCNPCPVNKYTMGTSPCRDCPAGLECRGLNLIYVKENWYAKVGVGTCYTPKTDYTDPDYADCKGKTDPTDLENYDEICDPFLDSNYDPDNSYIATTLCPPGYCCNSKLCEFPTAFGYTEDEDDATHDPNYSKCHPEVAVTNTTNSTNSTNAVITTRRRLQDDTTDGDTANVTYKLCAGNRDPSVPMCGACLPGYYETLSAAGNCEQCDKKGMSQEWIIPVEVLGVIGLVLFFFRSGKKEREIPHPFMAYYSKTLLFFYQILTFLTFRSSVQVVKPLAELLNFNVDVAGEGSGTCLLKKVTSIEKLWLNLLTPGIILVVLICFLGCMWVYHHVFKKRKNTYQLKDWKADELAMQGAFWNIFMIIYVQVTSAFIKLSICYPFGDRWYMWYAGDNECTISNGPLIFCNIMMLTLIIIIPLFIFRVMKWYKDNNVAAYTQIFAPLILPYSSRCSYYTPFNVFRRAVLIVLPSVPVPELAVRATLSTFAMGSIIAIHCYLMPFKWTINNHLETFVLLCGFFIATFNITDDPPEWFNLAIAFLATIPLVPLPFLFHDFAKLKSKGITDTLNLEFEWVNNDIEPAEEDNEEQKDEVEPDLPLPPTGTSQGGESVDPDDLSMHLPKLDTIDLVPDVIQPDATNSFGLGSAAVSINDEEEDDEEDDTVRARSPFAPTPQIKRADVTNQEDQKWTIPLGAKSLVVIKRAAVPDTDGNDDTDESKRKESSSVEKTEIETHFGTDYDFLPGTLPNWLRSIIGTEQMENDPNVISNPYIGDESESEFDDEKEIELTEIGIPLLTTDGFVTLRDPNGLEAQISAQPSIYDSQEEDISDAHSQPDEPDESIRENTNTTTYHSSTGARVEELLEETKDAELKPPIHLLKPTSISLADMRDAEESKRDIHHGIGRLETIRNRSNKHVIQTTKYNVIKFTQKGWKDVSDRLRVGTEDSVERKAAIPPSTNPLSELAESYTDDKQLWADITDNDYYVPDEYSYIDGVYGPLRFDPTFKSMIYCHHNCKWLELRVANAFDDGIQGNRVVTTWNIVDMKKQTVFYQAKGESLLIPPVFGWKRLIDVDTKKSQKDEIDIEILTKELKFFDCPEFVSLKSDIDSCISIEYDYKKLVIPDAPHIRQCIEVRAYKDDDDDDDEVFTMEIIELDDGDDDDDDD